MKTKSLLSIFVTTSIIGIFFSLSGETLANPFSPRETANYMPGELLVQFKSRISAQKRSNSLAVFGSAIQADLNHNLLHIKLGAGKTVETALSAYRNDPDIENAQPNYIYHADAVPYDTQYGQLWAFKNSGQTISPVPPLTNTVYTTHNPGTRGDDLNIEPAWDLINDCSPVVVAVIDSGINYNNEDLAPNMWTTVAYPLHGTNFTNEGPANDPMDLKGHGTHVAGIIGAAGNNSQGTTGVCWKASIMAVRVLDSTGSGTTANIIQGIAFAVSNGAKVINLSLGGGTFDQAFSDAITSAQSSDVVVIVAAGNNNDNNDAVPHYPCSFTHANLICVAALDQSYALASFSNWGPTSVHVGAPGTNILSTYAGSNATIVDPLNGGWLFNPTTLTGFVYGTVNTQYGGVNPSIETV